MIELISTNNPIKIQGIGYWNYRIEYDGNTKGVFKIFSKIIYAN